ncbi:MAG: hypothetical protein ACK52U_09500, partial [Synechococcaceae cyanobacterium]
GDPAHPGCGCDLPRDRQERLPPAGGQRRQRGFQEDSRPGAPLCRWCADDLVLELMPTQGEILGFSNRWYPLALDTAQLQGLPSGRSIRIVTAPVFLAAKLEAFRVRTGVSITAATGWRSRHAIAFTCCVSHRWRTSAGRTGSGDPWPDSGGG